MKKMTRVNSLGDLRLRANLEVRYQKLAIIAASNLGGDIPKNAPIVLRYEAAMKVLETNAAETSEKGVVDEVNFVRDLVK